MASIIAKVSNAVFEDFQRNLADEGGNFRELIQGFFETCDFATRAIEKVLSESPDMQGEVAEFHDHLFHEKAAYDLMLKMSDSDVLAAECENPEPNSFLTQLFKVDVEFRRLATLLHWSEEIAFSRPEGFSRPLVDVEGLHEVQNVYSHSKMAGDKPVHLDMQFTGDLAREDEASVRTMQKFLFALLRCGRLVDAKHLLENAGLTALCPLVTMRQVVTNPLLTPTNPLHDNHNLAKSRMFFKRTARELLELDNGSITMEDRCVWATLSGNLQTLLSNAASTDDRLWAYVTSAVETLLDESLLSELDANDEQMTSLDWIRAEETGLKDSAGPRSVSSIFTELRKVDNNPFYALYGHLASSNWRGVLDFVGSYVEAHNTRLHQQPHMLRFLSHLVLLVRANFKEENFGGESAIFDDLICDYTDALAGVRLHSLVPFYLFRLTPVSSKAKIVAFLQGIEDDGQRREILTAAVEAGLDVVDLCRSVYASCKSKYKLGEKTSKADWEAMARSWQWLTYSGVETAREALVEANRILRKMFLHDRMDEAEEMLSGIPEDLPNRVQSVPKASDEDLDAVELYRDAQCELDYYVLYFEAMSKYSVWRKQVETSTPPDLPKRLSDDAWSRMDITKRTEYELSLGKARECLHKYNRLGELLKKRAVELLQKVLCMKHHCSQDASCERREELKTIREKISYYVACLLVGVHAKCGDRMEVLRVASLLVDPQHEIDKVLSKESLRKLTSLIVASGGAALIDDSEA